MKKYHLYLWIVALVGLMTSCSQDETDALPTDTNANRVTLTASLPADFAQPQPQSRALPTPPANHQLRCILEVWTQDPTSPALKYRKEKVGLTGDNVVFDFTIDEGKYDCLFWADFIETGAKDFSTTIGGLSCTHYDDKFYATNNTTKGLKAISIIANNFFNTDARDAFFGHYVLNKETAAVENPSIPALTRPFAKLTIKEKNATNYGYCNGLTAKYQVPTTFNVLDGTVSGTAQVTCSSKSTESQTLFSDYILTGASSTLGEIELTFTGVEGKELQPVTIPAGIPLKRNYKTNAAGSLISEEPVPTKDVKLTVDINSDWVETAGDYDVDALVWNGTSTSEPAGYNSFTPGEVNITTAAELAWLAQQNLLFENYTFKLTADIDLNNHEWTPIGSKITFKGTFDGQGHTVSNLKCTTSKQGGLFANIAHATVKDVTVSGSVSFNTDNGVCQLGGIVAYVTDNSTITGCTNQCTIAATGSRNKCNVGGIAGYVANQNSNSNINFTISNNTNTGTVSDNGQTNSCAGGIIGGATATNFSSITLTGNSYDGGIPSDVCIGFCFMMNSSTITIDGTEATNNKAFPVPQS